MSIYVFPAELCPSKFGMQLMGNVKVNESVINGEPRRVEYPGDRWLIRAEFPPMRDKVRARKYHAFFNRFRGGLANTLRIWPLEHPRPYGTMSGTPVLADAAPYGANQIVIEVDEVDHTIFAGDMIGVTLSTGVVQLCEVQNDPAGLGGYYRYTDISPPLRASANGQSAIVWDRPTIDCSFTSHPFNSDIPAFFEGFTFEAREIFLS